MSGELTLDNFVVMTRHFGNFYISKEKADKLDAMFDMPDGQRPYRIEIDEGTKLVFNDILGITTAAKLQEIERQKRGEWQCDKRNWHARNEVCRCGWGMAEKKKDEEREKELENQTPEQKERSSIIRDMRKKGIGFRDFSKLAGKTNEELKAMLDKM